MSIEWYLILFIFFFCCSCSDVILYEVKNEDIVLLDKTLNEEAIYERIYELLPDPYYADYAINPIKIYKEIWNNKKLVVFPTIGHPQIIFLDSEDNFKKDPLQSLLFIVAERNAIQQGFDLILSGDQNQYTEIPLKKEYIRCQLPLSKKRNASAADNQISIPFYREKEHPLYAAIYDIKHLRENVPLIDGVYHIKAKSRDSSKFCLGDFRNGGDLLINKLNDSLLFHPENFKNASKIFKRLRDANKNGETISKYIKKKLTRNFQMKIALYNDEENISEKILETFTNEFNALLTIENFYEKENFSNINLSIETQKLASKQNLKVEDIKKLNRLLLEDIYTCEIIKDNGISRFIKENLIIDEKLGEKELVEKLNHLIEEQCIYDEERFNDIQLSPKTKHLLSKKNNLNKKDKIELNRLLLEDAYPLEIFKNYQIHYNSIKIHTQEKDISTKENVFWFIVAADLQFHKDIKYLEKFYNAINDPENYLQDLQKYNLKNPSAQNCLKKIIKNYQKEKYFSGIKDALFIIIVGDIVDNGSSSASDGRRFFNILNVPFNNSSSYKEEYSKIFDFFKISPKPLFLIPGNHDGMVVLNWYNQWFGSILSLGGLIDIIAKAIGEEIEIIGLFENLLKTEIEDGLMYWRALFGPNFYSFNIGNLQFLCLNSYDLPYIYRSSLGWLAVNSGGYLEKDQRQWINRILKKKSKFLCFIHHDPRGGIPQESQISVSSNLCQTHTQEKKIGEPDLLIGNFKAPFILGTLGNFFIQGIRYFFYGYDTIGEGVTSPQEWHEKWYDYNPSKGIIFQGIDYSQIEYFFFGHRDIYGKIPSKEFTTSKFQFDKQTTKAVIRLDDLGNIPISEKIRPFTKGFTLVKVERNEKVWEIKEIVHFPLEVKE